MRVVLDTNILVRANPLALPRSLARELLLACIENPNQLLISAPMLAELVRVLQYPRLARRWPMSVELIASYVRDLTRVAVMVPVSRPVPAILSDPDDDPILDTAVRGKPTFSAAATSSFANRGRSKSVIVTESPSSTM